MQAMYPIGLHRSAKSLLVPLLLLTGTLPALTQEVEEISTANMVTLEPQTSSIRHLSWLPDGRLLAADDKEVVLWNPGNSFRVFSAKIHLSYPSKLGTFEDGKRLYVSDNRWVYSASIPDLQTISKFAESDTVNKVYNFYSVLSPDEKTLAVQRGILRVQFYSMTDQKEAGWIEPVGGVRAITYHPDGRLVVAARKEDETPIALYANGRPDPAQTFSIPHIVFRISVSPDGTKLAACSNSAAYALDLLAPTNPAIRIPASQGSIDTVVWTPDSKFLVTLGSSGKVEFWDASSLRLSKRISLLPGQTKSAAFSLDGKWFALGGGFYRPVNGGQSVNGDNRVRILPWNAVPTSPPRVATPVADQRIRTWTSSDGRKLEASIVALAGKDVILRTAGGKEFPVPMARLSEVDSQFIASWVTQNPMAALKGLAGPAVSPPSAGSTTVGYRFTVGWNKIKFDEKPKNIGGPWHAKVVTWKPKFKVTNTSGRELKDLMLVYQVQIRLDRDSKVDDYSFPTNKMLIPVIKSNQSLDIEGYGFETLDAKLSKDYITTDGSRRNKSDVILGSIVKLIHEGKIVHEYKSGTGMQDRLREKLSGLGISVQN